VGFSFKGRHDYMIYALMYKVYLISTVEEKPRFKIGYTRRKVEQRIKEFKTGNSSELEIIDVFESKWGTKIEANLHLRFKSKQIEGEWFFLTDDDILTFKKQCKDIHNMFELLNTQNTWFIDRGGF